MTDQDAPSRRDDIAVRLAYIERTLARLGEELATVRALADAEAAPQEPHPAAPQPREVEKLPSPLEPMPPRPVAPAAPLRVEPAAPVAAKPPEARMRPSTAPPKPPRRSLSDVARDWDLVGARGFAIVGGSVMALGIGLFFVLAANRGWINEEMRVAFGATASGLVFGAGLLLRARYGQYWSALAAVGAGISGAYATLAAAAARYDLLPDSLALPLAGLIAAAGTAVAIRWRSQVIAAIGLLGAALAPALQALDTEMTWESAVFAVIILVAAGWVSVPRGWRELLITTSVVVGVQVEWLAADAIAPVNPGTVAVAVAFVLSLLGISAARQIVVARADVDPIALGYALASFGVAMALATQLTDDRSERGIALLAAAGVWALVFAALSAGRLPDLGFVVGASALALAAVGTADLLSDAALTIAWGAEALVLVALARRPGDARLQVMGVAYVALASIRALTSESKPGFLFDEAADHAAGVLPLAAAAAAAIGAGLLVPAKYRERTEAGLLAFVGELRKDLAAHRREVRETLVFAGGALATLSAAFLLVSISFEPGHIAASFMAAAVGSAFLGAAGRLRSTGLAVASYAWLAVVLIEAFALDADRFYDDATELSSGGWSVIGASAGLLLGAYAHRLLDPDRRGRDVVLGIVASVAAVSVPLGVSLVAATERSGGVGLLTVAVVYVGLAAGVFSRSGFRNASTTLWSFGLVFLTGAESLLVTDAVWRAVLIAATALAVGALAGPLREMRLWLAGGSLAVATTAVVLLVQVQPWLEEGELDPRVALASAACALVAFGLAALVWREERWRDLSTLVWADGILALLATERVLLDDWRATIFAVALTGGVLALAASPLGESRVWLAGGILSVVTTTATMVALTPPAHLLVASDAPADGLWVLFGCLLGVAAVAVTAPDERVRVDLEVVAGGLALYALSLGILEVAERVSTASVETDFERGHTAVSGLWALIGLALLVIGLLRGSAAIRYGGLALFGLSLAKIFLYDLSSLSSVARAFSFILVGGLLLAGGFFLQRLSDRLGPPRHP